MMKDGEMKVTLELEHEACGDIRKLDAFKKKVEQCLGYKLKSEGLEDDCYEMIFRKVAK